MAPTTWPARAGTDAATAYASPASCCCMAKGMLPMAPMVPIMFCPERDGCPPAPEPDGEGRYRLLPALALPELKLPPPVPLPPALLPAPGRRPDAKSVGDTYLDQDKEK